MESEYDILSQLMRDVIPFIELIEKLKEVIPFNDSTPKIHFMVFEDSKGCVDLVKAPKMRPRTRHISLKYYHFRPYVKKELISMNYVETKE